MAGPYLTAGLRWHYEISGGIVPPLITSGDAIMCRLYRNANNGRHCVLFYEPGQEPVSPASQVPQYYAWRFVATDVIAYVSDLLSIGTMMFRSETRNDYGNRITIEVICSGLWELTFKVTWHDQTDTVLYNTPLNIKNAVEWSRDNGSGIFYITFGKSDPWYYSGDLTTWNLDNIFLCYDADYLTDFPEYNTGFIFANNYNADATSATVNDVLRYQAFKVAPKAEEEDKDFGPTFEPTQGLSEGGFTDHNIDFPAAITFGAVAGGLVNLYKLSSLADLGAFLWSSTFFDNIIKNFASPMENIVAVNILPVSVSGTAATIKIGNLDSGVSAEQITSQFLFADCGTVQLPNTYGNQLDYKPASALHIHLPYIGDKEIDLDDAAGGKVHLKYGIDLMTGACLALIEIETPSDRYYHKSVEYEFEGQCGFPVPLSGANYLSYYGQVIGGILSSAVGVANGNPMMAAGGISSIANAKPDYMRAGSLGGLHGYMGVQTPYLTLCEALSGRAQNIEKVRGVRSNKYVSLNSLSGLQQIAEWRPNDALVSKCTDEELNEIDSLLKGGVIF